MKTEFIGITVTTTSALKILSHRTMTEAKSERVGLLLDVQARPSAKLLVLGVGCRHLLRIAFHQFPFPVEQMHDVKQAASDGHAYGMYLNASIHDPVCFSVIRILYT